MIPPISIKKFASSKILPDKKYLRKKDDNKNITTILFFSVCPKKVDIIMPNIKHKNKIPKNHPNDISTSYIILWEYHPLDNTVLS